MVLSTAVRVGKVKGAVLLAAKDRTSSAAFATRSRNTGGQSPSSHQ